MKKKRVKILESIAGLADPKPRAELDAKYSKFKAGLEAREKPPSKATIDFHVAEMKKRDRYGEPELGFKRDWAFRPDAEVTINADLADKWEESGICTILDDQKKAA